MEVVWRYFKVQLPGYLRTLPLPKSIGEISELTRDDCLTLLPFLLFLVVLAYLTISPFFQFFASAKQPRPRINRRQKMDEDKVTNTFDIEDLGKNCGVFCRCWKSKKFPYCDGSHKDHNKITGDNVGPLIIKLKKTN